MSFHEIWNKWHIRDVRNVRVFDIDGGDYHLLDGIEDWIRPSMKLRALSERALRKTQLAQGWSNDDLVGRLRGDHDGNEDCDEEIYNSLRFRCLESEASKLIPGWRLNEILHGEIESDDHGTKASGMRLAVMSPGETPSEIPDDGSPSGYGRDYLPVGDAGVSTAPEDTA